MPAEEEKTKEKPRFVPEKDLVVWEAKSRPFKRRSREFYVTFFAIVGVIGFVFFVIEGVMPVILLAAITFLFYVLNTVEPGNIEYKITNKGIKIAESLTKWGLIRSFWFSSNDEEETLNLETARIPSKLEIVIDKEKKGEIEKALSKYILEEKIPPDNMTKATNWLAKKVSKE